MFVDNRTMVIDHTGEHLHPMPPCNGKLDIVAFKKLESIVLSALNVGKRTKLFLKNTQKYTKK